MDLALCLSVKRVHGASQQDPCEGCPSFSIDGSCSLRNTVGDDVKIRCKLWEWGFETQLAHSLLNEDF